MANHPEKHVSGHGYPSIIKDEDVSWCKQGLLNLEFLKDLGSLSRRGASRWFFEFSLLLCVEVFRVCFGWCGQCICSIRWRGQVGVHLRLLHLFMRCVRRYVCLTLRYEIFVVFDRGGECIEHSHDRGRVAESTSLCLDYLVPPNLRRCANSLVRIGRHH